MQSLVNNNNNKHISIAAHFTNFVLVYLIKTGCLSGAKEWCAEVWGAKLVTLEKNFLGLKVSVCLTQDPKCFIAWRKHLLVQYIRLEPLLNNCLLDMRIPDLENTEGAVGGIVTCGATLIQPVKGFSLVVNDQPPSCKTGPTCNWTSSWCPLLATFLDQSTSDFVPKIYGPKLSLTMVLEPPNFIAIIVVWDSADFWDVGR